MEGSFFRTIGDSKVSDGAHRMILSIISALTTMPKTAIATFPILSTLGHITDKLQIICGWEASLMTKIKETCHVKNKKLNDTGLFQVFFNTLDASGHPGTAYSPSPNVGKYYKLMMTDLANASIDPLFWRQNTTDAQIKLAKKLFNKPDSDTAILTSELLELTTTELALSTHSNLNPDAMSEPGSHFSGFDAARDLEPIFNQSQSINDAFLNASDNATTHQWSDCELEFFQSNEQSPLFRVDGECCLYFDLETNAFCSYPAVNNTARCTRHQDTANSKFMRILAKMCNVDTKEGYSLCQSAFRFTSEPKSNTNCMEYAPCLEGSLPAFKHSAANLKKLLTAGYKSYKAGYLTKSTIPFKDNYFVDAFPNTEITTRQWMHAYLSLRVSNYYTYILIFEKI